MQQTALGLGLIVLTASAAFGQVAPATPAVPATPAFDVASIRASQPGGGGEGRGGVNRRESIQFSPDSVTMRNVSLRAAIRWAYHVMDYQVTGPDFLGSQRFDIAAKSAAPVEEEQLRVMLQALLADRFKLTLHRQTKELSAYVLVVAKGGPKFKESKEEGESDIQPDQKRMIVTVQRTPVSMLADGLGNILRAPVIDQTGLTGKYDITINIAKYIPDMGGRGEGGGGAGGGGGGGPIDPISIITTGLQEELGLKLESRKMPLDLLIVDHMEKTPTEN